MLDWDTVVERESCESIAVGIENRRPETPFSRLNIDPESGQPTALANEQLPQPVYLSTRRPEPGEPVSSHGGEAYLTVPFLVSAVKPDLLLGSHHGARTT